MKKENNLEPNKPEIATFLNDYWDSAKKEAVNVNNKFVEEMPTIEEFFRDWRKSPLFPRQLKIVENTFTLDLQSLSDKYNEFVVAWGKGSGKDVTISELLNLIAFWLCHCKNPQAELGLKDGEPIDIVNIAFDSDCAETVFFEKFKRVVKDTIDPKTGKNYYEGLGMRLDKDILQSEIRFPKNIRAFSLNSVGWKAEGKNTVIAVFDEIGSFRFDKAESIRRHIRTTARTRCMKFHKIFYISFLTSGNDYMAHLIDRAENEELEKVYFDRAATWEVRNYADAPEELKKYAVSKADYQADFDADPESSMLMYECKIPKFNANSFIRQPQRILDCIGTLSSNKEDYRHSPRINNDSPWTYDLMNEELEPWFKPNYTEKIFKMEKEYENMPSEKLAEMIKFEKEKHANADYYVHIDLSRGVVDCAALTLIHKYSILETSKLYVDFMCQIRAEKEDDKSSEIDIGLILDFVIQVLKNKYKFNIVKITADGWNSALFLSLCEKEGIPAEVVSLERTLAPYETLKDYIYKGDIDFYFYSPLIRELKELIITDKKKVDHPRKSQWRMKEEQIPNGSKDISDSLAGSAYASSDNEDNEPLAYASGEKATNERKRPLNRPINRL